MNKNLIRATALSASLALALTAGISIADAAPGNIDTNKTGTITIVKLEQPDAAGTPASGRAQDVSGYTKLAGAEFKVEKVTAVGGVDVTASALNNSTNWDALAGATTSSALTLDAAAVATGTTDAEGEIVTGDLPVGLYLVTEIKAPTGATPSSPFLVALPFADDKGTPATSDDEWTYSVTVYPKNSVSGVKKELNAASDTAAIKTGDELVWHITGSLPASNSANRLTGVGWTDTLDARLTYVRVENVKFAGTDLQSSDYSAIANGQVVTVSMTDQWLATDHPKGDLTFDLVTTVNATHENIGADGSIKNKIEQTITIGGTTSTTTYSEEVESKWGEIVIAKKDSGNDARLDGAEFQVFVSEADAKAGTNPITIGNDSTFTTGNFDLDGDGTVAEDENGLALISALNTGAAGSRTYWVKETKAPAGYQLPSGDDAIHEVTVTAGARTAISITVENTKKTNLTLPITGGAGTVGLIALSMALAAGGAVVVVRNRRKEQEAA